MLLSYNPILPEESRVERLAKKWVNHLRVDELLESLGQVGANPEIIHRRPPNEHLFRVQIVPR